MAASFFVKNLEYLVTFILKIPFLGISSSGLYLYFAIVNFNLNLCFIFPTLRKIILLLFILNDIDLINFINSITFNLNLICKFHKLSINSKQQMYSKNQFFSQTQKEFPCKAYLSSGLCLSRQSAMYSMAFSGFDFYCAKEDRALSTRGMTVSSR